MSYRRSLNLLNFPPNNNNNNDNNNSFVLEFVFFLRTKNTITKYKTIALQVKKKMLKYILFHTPDLIHIKI